MNMLKLLVRVWFCTFNISHFQTAILLLRIDDIVSGTKKQSGDAQQGAPAPQASEGPEPWLCVC